MVKGVLYWAPINAISDADRYFQATISKRCVTSSELYTVRIEAKTEHSIE